jgi:hypothetical protein
MNESWVEELEKRGIEVIPNFLPDEAIKVFYDFKERDMLAYNGRQGT